MTRATSKVEPRLLDSGRALQDAAVGCKPAPLPHSPNSLA